MSRTLEGTILRWGEAYGIRLDDAGLNRLGLSLGDEVALRVLSQNGKVDISNLPVFSSGRHDVSQHHDVLLAKGLEEKLDLPDSEGDDQS